MTADAFSPAEAASTTADAWRAEARFAAEAPSSQPAEAAA